MGVGAKLFLAPVGNARHSEKCITFLEHEILLNFFVSEHVKMAMPFFVQEKHHFSLHRQKQRFLRWRESRHSLLPIEGHIAQLYEYARTAFGLAMEMGINLTRVITRPYAVKNGEFVRTENRRDVVGGLPSGVETLIDIAAAHGVYTISIGKCADVVNTSRWSEGRELPTELPAELCDLYLGPSPDKNPYSLLAALQILGEHTNVPRLVLCNLPDTDSLFGHNRLVEGALGSIKAFDSALQLLREALQQNGHLIVTADQGMFDGGNYGYHSREAVPVLGMGKNGKITDSVAIPASRRTYAVVGQICAELFGFGQEYLERCRLETLIR